MYKHLILAWALAGVLPGVAWGQGSGLAGACAAATAGGENNCYVVTQAVNSAQPQLGILLAGGNPAIGTTSGAGLRLGVLPRVSATIQANLVSVQLPDLREMHYGSADRATYAERSTVAPSLSGTATIGLFQGASVAPTISGIGSIDLLATASWLPLHQIGGDEFRPSSADLAYGTGLRLGLVRESFTLPGASVSILYHRLGTVSYGEVCPTRVVTSTTEGSGFTLEEGQCAPTDLGDMGEIRFDLSSWSTRAVVSKHFLGLGLAAGVGYDRSSSDVGVGFRAPSGGERLPDFSYAVIGDAGIDQGRWSAFVDGSFSWLVATLAVEAGWLQGSDPIAGYPESMSDFEPGDGSLFGSIGLRVAL